MVRMVSLKKSAADRRAEKEGMGSRDVVSVPAENEGVTVNLDHHHLMNMKVGGGMRQGHKVEFGGTGTVEHYSEGSGPDGSPRMSARLRLDRGGMDHEGDEKADPRGELKGELRKAVAGSERAKSDTSDNKTDKAGASGKKIAE